VTGRPKGKASAIAIVLVVTMSLIRSPAAAQPTGPVDEQKVGLELMPYIVFGGMGGDLTIKGRSASFSQSAGEVLSNLQFGFMGRTRLTYGRWFAALDGTFMGLGAANDAVDAGVDQVIVEPSAGYRVTPFLDLLAGARYNSVAMELSFRGPLAAQEAGEKTWWDPFVGGRVILPLGDKFSVSTRFDVGGFSAGSRVAVNAEPLFNIRVGRRGTLSAGWKFYYVDYKDTGVGFRYAALSQGPLVGANFAWGN
jgi:hypothetical protein